MRKFVAGDRVKRKGGTGTSVVTYVPGMKEYDEGVYIDAERGFCHDDGGNKFMWSFQEDWELVTIKADISPKLLAMLWHYINANNVAQEAFERAYPYGVKFGFSPSKLKEHIDYLEIEGICREHDIKPEIFFQQPLPKVCGEDVTEITSSSLRVGCRKVTLEEAELMVRLIRDKARGGDTIN